MFEKDLLFLTVVGLAVLLGLTCWFLDRRLGRLRQSYAAQKARLDDAQRRLKALEQKAAHPAPPPRPRSADRAAFAAQLDQAQIKTRLQGGAPGEIPEKYKLAASMAKRGLSVADISDILKISPGETEQLIKLSRVAV